MTDRNNLVNFLCPNSCKKCDLKLSLFFQEIIEFAEQYVKLQILYFCSTMVTKQN